MTLESTGTPTLYLVFTLVVIVLLVTDILMLRSQGSHRVSVKEATAWSVVWIIVSMAFCGWFWWYLDGRFSRELANEKALEYLTGYLIEKSLAVDNVFVWITLFNVFSVPRELQKRVLIYGVLGAIILRGILIFLGALLLATFHWVLYVFGLFLVVTGVKMLIFADQETNLEENPVLLWLRRHMRIADVHHGERFFVTLDGVRYATPLFLVLVFVEFTDLIFAVDSIPAIFAITNDPFIVFTSNIFAILGLRAMYFLLADMATRFHLIKYGLALILVIIGIKMLLLDIYKIPVWIALGIVALTLLVSVVASVLTSHRAGPILSEASEKRGEKAEIREQ